MTVYYDPQQPITRSVFQMKNTSFSVVMRKWEFRGFLLLHAVLVILMQFKVIKTADIGEPPWESAATVQFFMTFFLTFYNQHCFSRYIRLYEQCNDIMDGVLFFVHELTVSLSYEECEAHRTLATKYILSGMYIFFMGLTGGEMERKDWKELVNKNLLKKSEMEALAAYPGNKVTLVLMNWAMQVVDEALSLDVFWVDRSQRIAHAHNRINQHVLSIITSCNTVGHIIALPIPFPYFHLMNLVLVLNFFLVACVLSLSNTLLTIFPFTVVLMIFMGLREVATQLADPFGQDEVDFPVAEFLNYTFDQAVCLLEAFSRMDKAWLIEQSRTHEGFDDSHIKLAVDKQALYSTNRQLNRSFHWDRATPVSGFDKDASIIAHMRQLLQPSRTVDEVKPELDSIPETMEGLVETTIREVGIREAEVARAQVELQRRLELKEKMNNKISETMRRKAERERRSHEKKVEEELAQMTAQHEATEKRNAMLQKTITKAKLRKTKTLDSGNGAEVEEEPSVKPQLARSVAMNSAKADGPRAPDLIRSMRKKAGINEDGESDVVSSFGESDDAYDFRAVQKDIRQKLAGAGAGRERAKQRTRGLETPEDSASESDIGSARSSRSSRRNAYQTRGRARTPAQATKSEQQASAGAGFSDRGGTASQRQNSTKSSKSASDYDEQDQESIKEQPARDYFEDAQKNIRRALESKGIGLVAPAGRPTRRSPSPPDRQAKDKKKSQEPPPALPPIEPPVEEVITIGI